MGNPTEAWLTLIALLKQAADKGSFHLTLAATQNVGSPTWLTQGNTL